MWLFLSKRFPSRDRMSMLAFGLSFVLLLLLAACGGTTEQPKTKEEAAASEENSGGESKTRTIRHVMGNTPIPAEPKRIVVLDNAALDNLLALGVTPVGAASVASFDEPFPSYLKGTEGIAKIGTIEQPNLEEIMRLKPDLIIGTKVEHEAIYDKLAKIAPTIFIENVGTAWKENLRLHAEAIGKKEEGEKLIAAYEQRIEQFRSRLGNRTIEIALLRPRMDHVRVYLTDSFSGIIAHEAGLARPESQAERGQQHVAMTEEQIADLDADVILIFGREEEMGFFNEKILTNPIWKTLKAVKNQKVFYVSPETWLSGHGIQAANLMLDDLEQFILVP
jgi:iron complex transport system substrate-binding protein